MKKIYKTIKIKLPLTFCVQSDKRSQTGNAISFLQVKLISPHGSVHTREHSHNHFLHTDTTTTFTQSSLSFTPTKHTRSHTHKHKHKTHAHALKQRDRKTHDNQPLFLVILFHKDNIVCPHESFLYLFSTFV